MIDALYLPPKPAIILQQPREIIRASDPKFRLAPLLSGLIINPYIFAKQLSISWIGYGAIAAGQNPQWTNQGIGTAAVDRYVVVMLYSNSAGQRDVTSFTIGGNTATLLFTNNANYSTARTVTHFYGLLIPAGTTATMQANWTAAVDQSAISVYAVYGSTTPSVAQTAANNNVTSASVSLTIPVGGVGVGAFGSGNGGTVTWTNLTEDADVNAGTYYTFSTASSSIPGTLTRSAVGTGGGGVDRAMGAIALAA